MKCKLYARVAAESGKAKLRKAAWCRERGTSARMLNNGYRAARLRHLSCFSAVRHATPNVESRQTLGEHSVRV